MAVFNSSMLQPTEPTLVQAAPAFLVGTWRIEPDVAHPDAVTATVELGDGASLPTTFSDFAGERYLFSRSDERGWTVNGWTIVHVTPDRSRLRLHADHSPGPDAVWTRQSAEWMVGPWSIAADDEHPDEVQVTVTAAGGGLTAEFSDFPGQGYAVELNARGGMSINRWSLVFVHSTLRTMVWRRAGHTDASWSRISQAGDGASSSSAAAATVAAVTAAVAVSALAVPRSFACPITQEVMTDPVVTVDGHSFERAAIEEWFRRRVSNPLTGLPLDSATLTPNHTLRGSIAELMNRRPELAPREDELTDVV